MRGQIPLWEGRAYLEPDSTCARPRLRSLATTMERPEIPVNSQLSDEDRDGPNVRTF